jgi:hypothetical protein
MAKRKTVNVDEMCDYVNNFLKNHEGDDIKSVEIRRGAILVLEKILETTNNYNGFRYLRSHEIADKFAKPGIYDPDETTVFTKDTDNTRVQYFY